MTSPPPDHAGHRARFGRRHLRQPLAGRRKLPVAGASTVIVAAARAIGVPGTGTVSNTVSTDDAYVNSHVTFVGPRVRGQVARVASDDNSRVRPGDVLFLIQSQSQARHQSSYICIVPSEADRAASGGSRSSSQVKACDGACRPLSSAFRARSTACPAARCAQITASAARPLQAILDKNPPRHLDRATKSFVSQSIILGTISERKQLSKQAH